RRHTRSDRDWSSDVCSSDLHARERNYIDVGSAIGDFWILDLRGLRWLTRSGRCASFFANNLPHLLDRATELALAEESGAAHEHKIGRASCRERVEMWVGAGG